MECIPLPHDLHTVSYPIVNGIWYPDFEVLEEMAAYLTADAKMLEWAHRQAGMVLIHELQNPGAIPDYMYPDGDFRPVLLAGPPPRQPVPKNPPTKAQPADMNGGAHNQPTATVLQDCGKHPSEKRPRRGRKGSKP